MGGCKIESLQILNIKRLASDINHCTVEPQSQMGQKILVVLTGNHINDGSLQENVWPFCWTAKKKIP